jgi:polycomb protein EED
VPLLNLYHTPTHDPVVTLVYPERRDGGGGDFLMVNLVHLKPKGIPVFPLDGGATKKRKMKALVDAAQGLSIVQADDGNVYADDPDTEESDEEIDKTPLLNGREEVEPPGLEGWKMSILGEGPRLMNCALGMGGRMIVGVGSESSLWVWKIGAL